MKSWAAVATPHLVYVGIDSREEFDRLALPVEAHPPQQLGGQPMVVLTKRVGEPAEGVMVVFQHWIRADQEAISQARNPSQAALFDNISQACPCTAVLQETDPVV